MHHAKLTLRLISFFFLFSLFLSACARTVTQPDPITKSQPTETLTLPTFAPTETTTATVQLQPSRTLAHPKPTGTPFFKATEIAQFPVQCTDFELEYFALISPDGNWLAFPCGYLPNNQVLELVNRNGQRRILQFKDYLPKGFLVGSLRPQYWSDDGKFLYFAPRIGYSRGEVCFNPDDGKALYRINVDDGDVSTVLPSSFSELGYYFKISPTGQKVAYLGSGDPTILDLITGQEIIFTDSKDVSGDFTWSPDGQELAYTSCQPANTHNLCLVSKSAVLIYSMQENFPRIILEVERNSLHIEAWNGKILKIIQRNEQCDESYLFFDVSTGQWLNPTTEP